MSVGDAQVVTGCHHVTNAHLFFFSASFFFWMVFFSQLFTTIDPLIIFRFLGFFHPV
jgi:hypothetical protein